MELIVVAALCITRKNAGFIDVEGLLPVQIFITIPLSTVNPRESFVHDDKSRSR